MTQNKNVQDSQENKNTGKMTKTREELIKMFLDILKSDEEIPFAQIMNSMKRHRNGCSEHPYRGINRFILSLQSICKGYKDRRWYTFKQVQDNGWKMKKGEKATPVEFWYPFNNKTHKRVDYEEYNKYLKEQKKYERKFASIGWRGNTWFVFNAEQVEGVPEIDPSLEAVIPEAELFTELLSRNMGVKVIEKGNKAYYRLDDCIVIPPKEACNGIYEYYHLKLHELAHASGAADRLNREELTSNEEGFGTEKYAKEELCAEITSSFLASDLQMETSEEHFKNHAAYVHSWIKILEEKPEELFKAIKKAEDASCYMKLMGMYEHCMRMNEAAKYISIESTEDYSNDREFRTTESGPLYRSVHIIPDGHIQNVDNCIFSSRQSCLNDIKAHYPEKIIESYAGLQERMSELLKKKQEEERNLHKKGLNSHVSKYTGIKENYIKCH